MSNLKQIFESYPEQTELYVDDNNVAWTNKETAKAQCPGKKIIIVKRTELFKHKNDKK